MEYLYIDGLIFEKMVANGCKHLEDNKGYINSLNVFPVPDGDTGTNMSMTFKSAFDEIEKNKNTSIGDMSNRLSKGALMGARGNSGVILSQIFRGIAKGFEGLDKVDSSQFANAISEGSKAAYKAVMKPTEGTILTIVKGAEEAALKSTASDITVLLEEVCNYSETVLSKTPEMLLVLKKAKVVDAGGAGLLVIFKGMLEALKYDINVNFKTAIDTKLSGPAVIPEADIKFAYCTEFFVSSKAENAELLKNDITSLGDSMLVIGMDDIIKVHIHSNDPGLILSKALKYGELSKLKIENMKEQHRNIQNITQAQEASVEADIEGNKKYGIITVAMGDGIENIFYELGVDYVIKGGQTMNPSTQDILECINKLNTDKIFVFPNNKNIIMAASQAVALTDKDVTIISTKNIPQGIAGITMFNPDSSSDDNIREMENAVRSIKSGLVTFAVRETEIDNIKINKDDILGLIENKIKETGNDIFEVCDKTISDMVDDDSSLITMYYGADCDKDKVKQFLKKIEEKYSDLDVQLYEGAQPLYYFILSVE